MKFKNVVIPALVISVLTLVLVSCGTKESEIGTFDWPCFRGPNRDGISEEKNWNPTALAERSKVLWKVDVGKGYSNVVIKDNRLYTMGKTSSTENEVFCLNAKTGREIWRYTFESLYDTKSTPTLDAGLVYVLSGDGLLVCLNAINGKLQWKKDITREFNVETIQYGYATSPVIEGDILILNVNTAGIALNKNTGELIWASTPHQKGAISPDGYHATPVPYDCEGSRCALLFSGTGLFSVDVQTGEPVWFYELHLRGPNAADPVLFDNKVFISTNYKSKGKCVLLDISGNKPEVVWQNENMRNQFSACVFVDGYLYGSDGDVNGLIPFRCIDIKTGDVRWEKKMRVTSLIAAGDTLIILEGKGTLHLAKATPSSYQEIASCDVLGDEEKLRQFWTPPVLYGGRIYCRNYLDDLVCIDVSK